MAETASQRWRLQITIDCKSSQNTSHKSKKNLTVLHINTFAASYLNTQGLNNSRLKSRQRRP